ncbi:MAG TPA: DUF1009 domain-containing protein [Lentisphaeria bacterium]|jgi:DUF1009 family protein|nr:DUF1009 domain-containing protein [Lentisphaeria bacterium]
MEALGLVAGRGIYPVLFAKSARAAGVCKLVVSGIVDDAVAELEELADEFEWVHAGQLNRTIKHLRKHDVKRVVFAGQVTPGKLFKDLRPDWRAAKVLARLKLKNADTIFTGLAKEFESEGITVLPATTYLEDALASEGVMGRVKPSRVIRSDIGFGREICTKISEMDIGQCVVVKNGTVLAVEAFEGTDKAIQRGGELGRGQAIIVKMAKPKQDMRFDVPCIGMRTVESLISVNAAALATEAGRTLLLEREQVIAALDAAGIAIVGF